MKVENVIHNILKFKRGIFETKRHVIPFGLITLKTFLNEQNVFLMNQKILEHHQYTQ